MSDTPEGQRGIIFGKRRGGVFDHRLNAIAGSQAAPRPSFSELRERYQFARGQAINERDALNEGEAWKWERRAEETKAQIEEHYDDLV